MPAARTLRHKFPQFAGHGLERLLQVNIGALMTIFKGLIMMRNLRNIIGN